MKDVVWGCVFMTVAGLLTAAGLLATTGCTVKAVGDPKRPITIEAHITVDVKGLKQTASGIEDMVSGGQAR